MINLLSNAVKFTEDDGTVGFGVAVVDDHAVITVSDTGIGIPTDEQGDLFQRFFRSSTAQVRQIQGTGLGLSIVAAIVAGHGGTIEVKSGHLQGSTFTVKLPLARSRATDARRVRPLVAERHPARNLWTVPGPPDTLPPCRGCCSRRARPTGTCCRCCP